MLSNFFWKSYSYDDANDVTTHANRSKMYFLIKSYGSKTYFLKKNIHRSYLKGGGREI